MDNLKLEVVSSDDGKDNQIVVKVFGSLLQSTLINDFVEHIDSAQRKQLFSANEVCVDFSNVERIDTAGLAWVLNMLSSFVQQQIQLSFRNIPEQLLNLASLSNAKELLTEYSNL